MFFADCVYCTPPCIIHYCSSTRHVWQILRSCLHMLITAHGAFSAPYPALVWHVCPCPLKNISFGNRKCSSQNFWIGILHVVHQTWIILQWLYVDDLKKLKPVFYRYGKCPVSICTSELFQTYISHLGNR